MKALVSPHPLGAYLPALYQEDEFAQRWTSGLDVVLAPIFHSMDNIEAYLDPRLAPADFLDWLASWMGLVADETWPAGAHSCLKPARCTGCEGLPGDWRSTSGSSPGGR